MTTQAAPTTLGRTASEASLAFWGRVGELIDAYPDRPATFSGQHPVNRLAARLKEDLAGLAEELSPHEEGWITDASVGKGVYAKVPWAAVFDERVTSSARRGFYPVVHLFTNGSPSVRVGLCVGSDQFDGNAARAREAAGDVHRRLGAARRRRLVEAGLTDCILEAGRTLAVERHGKTASWNAGMVFELVVDRARLAESQGALDDAMRALLDGYRELAGGGGGGEAAGAVPVAQASAAATERRVWFLAPGRAASHWPQCQREGLAAVGWSRVGDLRRFSTEEEVADELRRRYDTKREPTNNAKTLWNFREHVREGDLVVAKVGLTSVVGVGRVTGGYEYRPDRGDMPHVRSVEWIATGNWTIPGGTKVAQKTLTDYTGRREIVEWVESLLRGKDGDGPGDPLPPILVDPFTMEDLLEDVFIGEAEATELLVRLRRKRNLVLAGPPGVGKTFLAGRLAYLLLGERDRSRVETVQFHQSYAYEDFVQGYRPTPAGLQIRNGVFFEFVRRARESGRPHVFIIDEINRGNLSKIFGELMVLIEADKRGEAHGIPLMYASEGDARFWLPENLYLIGMMNTADRSLAMVDYALRRRFAFATLRPAFEGEAFGEFLDERGVPAAIRDRIVARMAALNARIAGDRELGEGFQIGHSFFCPSEDEDEPGESWYRSVVEAEVQPLLEEYWAEAPSRAREAVRDLLAS